MIHLTNSFLANRSFRVKINNSFSASKSIPAGVPQGAVLSPTLFSIYLYDLPTDENCTLVQFADDITMIKSARNGASIRKSLQDYTNVLTRYLKKWKLELNSSKTESIFLHLFIFLCFPEHLVQVQDHRVEWKNHVNYLGVQFDQKLLFNKHIEQIIFKCGACMNTLYSLINRNSRLHPADH